MMKDKKNTGNAFLFYGDWWTIIKNYPENTRLEIYDAIMEYGLYGNLPTLEGEAKGVFDFIKLNIDRAKENYKKQCAINKQNGSKGGAPKGNKNAKKQPKTTLNDNENNDNRKKIIKKESIIFTNFQLWLSKNASYCTDPEYFKQLSENELLKLLNTYSLTQIRRVVLDLESEKIKFKKQLTLYKVLIDRLKKENKQINSN